MLRRFRTPHRQANLGKLTQSCLHYTALRSSMTLFAQANIGCRLSGFDTAPAAAARSRALHSGLRSSATPFPCRTTETTNRVGTTSTSSDYRPASAKRWQCPVRVGPRVPRNHNTKLRSLAVMKDASLIRTRPCYTQSRPTTGTRKQDPRKWGPRRFPPKRPPNHPAARFIEYNGVLWPQRLLHCHAAC
jgi:hypothetical protein